MSEFKFACPICGQHITADSGDSGNKIECPTCFRKIVVPQAPASGESKFIISASEATGPRPTPTIPVAELSPGPAKSYAGVIFGSVLVLVLAGAAAAYVLRDKIFPHKTPSPEASSTNAAKSGAVPRPMTVYPVPTNTDWTLGTTNAVVPEENAGGRIHGHGFSCERATLQGGSLTLRQGASGPADLGVTIAFFAQAGEELSGKSVEVLPDKAPPNPKVTVRWKNDQGKAATHSYSEGYLLRITFSDAANGRISGKLYLAVPDEEKSFVAGSFNADIRKPAPPKSKTPKKPKAPKPG